LYITKAYLLHPVSTTYMLQSCTCVGGGNPRRCPHGTPAECARAHPWLPPLMIDIRTFLLRGAMNNASQTGHLEMAGPVIQLAAALRH
jgi:hypothetical protein